MFDENNITVFILLLIDINKAEAVFDLENDISSL